MLRSEGAEVQRYKGAEVQRCRGTKVQRCRGTKVQRCRGAEVQRCRVKELQNKKGYHNLLIWQKARELVKLIYQITEKFPRSELFGLVSQIRRAILSVILNIVEGDRRKSNKEFLKFLDIADASLTEVESCLEIALDLGFISQDDFDLVETKRKELAVMLSSFIEKIKTRSYKL